MKITRHDPAPATARDERFVVPVLLLAVTLSGGLAGCGLLKQRAEEDDARGAGDQQVLAIVGGKTITAGELRDRILERYYGRRALEGIIKEILFQREADELGIAVTDETVQQRVDDEIESMLAELGHDRAQLDRALAEQGTTLAEHRRSLTSEYRNLVLVEEVVKAHRKRVGISDEAIAERHRRAYDRLRVRVRHIAFPLPTVGEDGAAVAAGPAAERARARADQVKTQLDSGAASFEALARRLSGDPVTAERGGLLGWIDRETLREDELSEQIFSLPVGVVSEPTLQQGYGYHLFLVVERREPQPLAAVRQQIEQELISRPPEASEIRELERMLRARTPVDIFMDSDRSM